MKKTAAIFDLDGTLITFNFDSKGTKGELLAELGRAGVAVAGLDTTSPTQAFLDRARDWMHARGEGHQYPVMRRRLYSVIDSFELESIKASTLFPGTSETLHLLKAKGVVLSLVTNSGKAPTEYKLDSLGLSGLFEFVVTRDDVVSMKPSPEGIVLAISRLPAGVEEVYYVGDSPYDIAAAKSASVKVVSVPTGNYTADRLRAEGADFLIASLTELPGILGV